MIIARYGTIRNCLVIGDQVVITTLGLRQSAQSGVIAIYTCAASDVRCHNGRTLQPATGWQFYLPPHPGGVTMLAQPSPSVLLVDNAGDQVCFDLKSHRYGDCGAARIFDR